MPDAIDLKLREIDGWERARCLTAWARLTGLRECVTLSTPFLRRALAFEHQCKTLGGQSAAVRRQLRSLAVGETVKADLKQEAKPSKPQTLTLGTQLVREWNGRIYRVRVTGDGFEMDGQSYRSLTAIAKRITGAGWSGPRFFGLTKR